MNRFCTCKAFLAAIAIAALLAGARPAHAYRRHGRSYTYSAMRARQQMYVNMAANAQLSAACSMALAYATL